MFRETAERRRERLVDRLLKHGHLRSESVAAAMRRIPRHLFVPEAGLSAAYADEVIVTKQDRTGRVLSSASQPAIVAIQLEQLAVEPGQRVLEIGAGTGYNAALLADLAGPNGQVTTIDVDQDIVDGARDALAAAGHPEVSVILGDGEVGWVDNAPYDRIIATVGAGDVPSAWWEQLAPGGRVVLPLAFRGLQRGIGFAEHDGRLVSDSLVMCGFIPMRGIGAYGSRSEPLTPKGDVRLYRDPDQAPAADLAALLGDSGGDVAVAGEEPGGGETSVGGGASGAADAGGAAAAPVEWWSGTTLNPYDRWDTLDLMLAVTEPGYRRLSASTAAQDRDIVRPLLFGGASAITADESVAYLARRTDFSSELGVIAHGPEGPELLARLRRAINIWRTRYRNAEYTPTATLTRKPADPPATGNPIEKPHTWLSFEEPSK